MSEDYTTEPTHVRVFDEDDGWAIDGADGNGRYTEAVWKFDTREEAESAIPDFIAAMATDWGYNTEGVSR